MGGPIATIAKVKSAFRLVALDARALALGLRPMLALADARAMYPALAIHKADPDGERATRDDLVDWCRRFTPLAAPDGDDGAILDISGCAHLFGGAAAMMDDIRARLARQGFTSNLAVAGTPGAAWALARFGGGGRVVENMTEAAGRKLFASMPLAALRLEGRIITRLGQAGLRRVGDLMLRPRAPIAARFGRDIHHRLDVLLGRARDPISPRFEAPAFVAERRFAEGLARREDIEAAIHDLAHDLCGLLARHGEGARRLDVSLYRVDGIVKHIEAGTSRPLRDPDAMARLFRERIEAVGEDGLDTGYGFDVIRLAALSAEPLDAFQPDWAEARAEGAEFGDLVDRLGARFGMARVTRLALADSHRPETAAAVVPAAAKPEKPAASLERVPTGWTHPVDKEPRHFDMSEHVPTAKPASTFAGHAPARVPTGRNRLADKEPRRSNMLEHVPTAKPASTFAGHAPAADADALPMRPIRLFDRPEPIETVAEVPDGPPLRFRWRRVVHQVAAIEGPERLGPDWWTQGADMTRDYFRAEDTNGRRFWLYREGLYRDERAPRWFLHGLFA